ncbi:hypothetical protein MRB53_032512 [Persea americana]|uniref:Uncharacterized protein n=1 Tax=Persea americana TaxID=3435 RepID=A0ACC2KS37_PERAE|nr:hypothetical protein MRB53_032512 [Persea americana]
MQEVWRGRKKSGDGVEDRLPLRFVFCKFANRSKTLSIRKQLNTLPSFVFFGEDESVAAGVLRGDLETFLWSDSGGGRLCKSRIQENPTSFVSSSSWITKQSDRVAHSRSEPITALFCNEDHVQKSR